MELRELTIGQVKDMLLDTGCRKYWDTLKDPLREQNGREGKYPLVPITYALATVAAWHALSEGTAPEEVTLSYLEGHYQLKDLFWDSKNRKQYAFSEYLGMTLPKEKGDLDQRAGMCLEKIRRACGQKPFQPERPFRDILDRIREEDELNPTFVDKLEEIMGDWVRDVPEAAPAAPMLRTPAPEPAPEAEPPRGPVNPEKGSDQLKKALDATFAKDVIELLESDVKQIIFTGAPGTGKTYAARLLARYLGDMVPSDKPRPYTMVQFHPSYDYTDFVEGLRPVQKGSEMHFVKLDGSFKAFCRKVAEQNRKNAPEGKDPEENPSGKYFFIIDEINRADLSKVFGELMYCMDTDKRGDQDRVQTQYQNLRTYNPDQGQYLAPDDDVFADGFYVPKNVYIIGTMNDIDRSVESMDFAMRRRFLLHEAVVDAGMLKDAFAVMGFGGNAEGLAGHVDRLNQVIEKEGKAYGLSRQYDISHGQFTGLPTSIEKTGPLDRILKHVWKFRLKSLLREYLRGVNEEKIDTFTENCEKAFFGDGTV